MDVCDASPIISDKKPCKMCSNNLWNYGSFSTLDNINKPSLTLSVMPDEIERGKFFKKPYYQTKQFLQALTREISPLWRQVIKISCFVTGYPIESLIRST